MTERRVRFADDLHAGCAGKDSKEGIQGSVTDNEAKALRARQCAMEAMQQARCLKSEIRGTSGKIQSTLVKERKEPAKTTSSHRARQAESDANEMLKNKPEEFLGGLSFDWLTSAFSALNVAPAL
eukprot:CAMPEP_0113693252 /NCGR_PEP_ID=MMETSP0038_2-20120614/19560_1 /TAXON_ID=2898 /ORGANISM="Cryptomonas paramecium" /LENGTH=124 /DNA_ID=CAMNT_0000615301 /DNA_START=57 /DNA_END=431 /DNA_ORIENTATION=- /assembly_acc=CAM_ASM_000170